MNNLLEGVDLEEQAEMASLGVCYMYGSCRECDRVLARYRLPCLVKYFYFMVIKLKIYERS